MQWSSDCDVWCSEFVSQQTEFEMYFVIIIINIITAIEFSLGGTNHRLVQTKQITINIHKQNNTKTQHN